LNGATGSIKHLSPYKDHGKPQQKYSKLYLFAYLHIPVTSFLPDQDGELECLQIISELQLSSQKVACLQMHDVDTTATTAKNHRSLVSTEMNATC